MRSGCCRGAHLCGRAGGRGGRHRDADRASEPRRAGVDRPHLRRGHPGGPPAGQPLREPRPRAGHRGAEPAELRAGPADLVARLRRALDLRRARRAAASPTASPRRMPDGQGQAATFDLGSAERIEVLRGPFSSLYGNASGGVIQVVHRTTARREPTVWRRRERRQLRHAGARRRSSAAQWGRVQRSSATCPLRAPTATATTARRRATTRTRSSRCDLAGPASLTLVANALEQPETQDPLGLDARAVRGGPAPGDRPTRSSSTRARPSTTSRPAPLTTRASARHAAAGDGLRRPAHVEQFLGDPARGPGARLRTPAAWSTSTAASAAWRLRCFHALAPEPAALSLGGEYDA